MFPVSSLKEIFLSPSLRFGILVENQLAVRAKVYFWTLEFFFLLTYMSVSVALSCHLGYYSFATRFET